MSALTITLLQTNLFWEDPAANRAMLTEKISRIGGTTQLLILPEMFSTGFSMDPERLAETMQGPTVTWMKQTAVQHRMIITGSLIIREEDQFFNRLLWVLPDGKCGYYDKRHLFAFAGEDKKYSQGKRRLIASVNGWKILLLICYDLRFPVWSRQNLRADPSAGPSEPEYDLIIYVANWPERRAHAWKTLLQARAIENQCYVAAVNRVGADGNGISHSGDSMLVDPYGAILATCSQDEWIHTAVIEKQVLNTIRTQFPFLKDADPFYLE